jgi:hypothetical protein
VITDRTVGALNNGGVFGLVLGVEDAGMQTKDAASVVGFGRARLDIVPRNEFV